MSIAEFAETIRRGARGDLLAMLPYAATLGLVLDRDGDDLRLVMPYADGLIGAPGRLHGGAIAGLLELAGIATLLAALPGDEPLPQLKPVTVTVDYLREGAARDTVAAATLTRLGRRVANLNVVAWQDDRGRPIATAKLNIILDRA